MEHELEAVKPSKLDKDPAEQNWQQYVRCRDGGHTDYVDRADKCDRFYRGEQWDAADKAKLAEQGRPALTINEILPTINTVLGEQAAKRATGAFRPKKNGNAASAGALTKLSMQILEDNKFDYIESEVFADGLIAERGYFDIRMCFDDHMLGDVKIRALNPREVLLDPDASEYDPRTWPQVIVSRWMTLDEIEQYYGEKKADELRGVAGAGDGLGYDSIRFNRETTFGDSDAWLDRFTEVGQTSTIRRVRVIERQHYRMKPTLHFVTPTGDLRMVPETWDRLRAEIFAQTNGLALTNKIVKRIRWTVSADKVLLHDSWGPYKTFTPVPYFCYFRRGKPFGMVTNLLDPQELLNKSSSQELHIVNTTANSGWIVESGSLVGMTTDELRKVGAETGLVLEVAPNRTPPAKITPNHVPTGLDRVSLKAQNNIRSISGISEAMMGFDTPEVSGVALENKEKRGQIQIQKPLDNLGRTRQMVFEKILELVQQFYTEERTLLITNEWMPGMPQEELVVNQQTAAGVLNDLTIGEYSVVITTMPAHDTYDDLMFAESIQLRNTGVLVPDHHVIKHSHLPNRDEIAEEVAKLQGFGQPTPEEMQMAQIQQELALRSMQAEVAKLETEVKELESRVALNYAKADELDEKGRIEQMKLIKELEEKKMDLHLRTQLAQLSSMTQLEKQNRQNETRLVGDAMNRSGQLTLARMNQNKTQPKKESK